MKSLDFLSIKITLVLFLVSITGVFAQMPDVPALTPKLIAQKSLPSIVILVVNNGENLPITTGSGFFVAEDTIVTNYHVIKNAKVAALKIYGGSEVYSVIGTVGIDTKNDLALLKVNGVKGKSLKINAAYQLSIGDEVFTVSAPKGLEGTFSQGMISGLRRTAEKDLIQITAPISHGSSGGAILNNQAEVVAVAVGGIDEGQSLNFAVPIRYVQALMGKRTSLAELPGKMDRPYGNGLPPSKGLGEVGSGGGQGSGLGSSVKSPTTIVNESSIKAPSAVLELLKSRIPPKPNSNQFTNKHHVLEGDVFVVLDNHYEAVTNFGKVSKGEKLLESLFNFNREGNLTIEKEINYGDDARSETKTLYFYNPTNRIVKYDEFLNGKFKNKGVGTYNSKGEEITRSLYDEKGELVSKFTNEYTSQFSASKGCTADNDCSISYEGLDENGIETFISYKNKNLASIITTEDKGAIVKKVIYNFCHGGGFDEDDEEIPCTYNGKMSKITDAIAYYDPQTKYIISESRLTRNLDDPNEPVEKESYKYEYKLDSKGNWVEQITRKEIKKFGETSFEATEIIVRQIKYYSDPDTKPSVGKKSNVQSKRN